ncbi:MAG: TolC family protein [Gammaproteobacteria bacterium]|nr:TolC family protein [Gammaproteobacteria bacterium]
MRIISFIAILLNATFCFAEQKVDLLHAFQDASQNDPVYQQQVAIFNAVKQDVPKSYSALLPLIDLSAAIAREFNNPGDVPSNEFFSTSSYMISAEQTVFNYSQFNKLDESRYTVRAAYATLTAQQQDLMARTAKAYLDVLRTREILHFIEDQKAYMKTQLEATLGLFDLREATITDLEQAKGAASLIDANLYDAQINFYDAVQVLSQITAFQYDAFSYLNPDFPLHTPEPNNIDRWTETAEKTNWFLRAARLNIEATKKSIEVVRGDFLPNIRAALEMEHGAVPNQVLTDTTQNQDYSYGLNARWNAFHGGLTMAQEKEARANLNESSAAMRQQYLRTMANTRQAFNTVLVGVPRIKTVREALVSNTKALLYAQESYRAGESSITEILQIQFRLYASQVDYAQYTYGYLYNIILLKQAEGTLSVKDLVRLNRYLIPNKPKQKVRIDSV